MARKTPEKKTSEAPSAAETATAVQGHPWWPDLDGAKVAKLVVFRVVYEDRKGFPGAGKSERVNLTPEPVPPAMLTTERQIAEAWGAGFYEIEPRDGANRFVAGGGVKSVQIADKNGRVPKFVREFEGEEEDDGESDTEEVKRLKLELKLERDARREERGQFDVLLRQQREASREALADARDAARAERESLGALFEQISKASQMAAPQASALAAAPDWMRERMQRLEDEARALRDSLHEERIAKTRAELAPRRDDGVPGREPDLVDQFVKALPLLEKGKEFLDGINAQKREAAEAAAAVAKARAEFKLGGYAVLRVEELRAARLAGKRLDPSKPLARIFRELHGDGMLPPAYVAELVHHGLTFDAPSEGQSSDADGAPRADGEAVG